MRSDSIASNAKVDLLYPLSEFYEQTGEPLPPVTQIEEGDLPEPYKGLLAHDRDMTPTIEDAYGQSVALRVVHYALRENVFSRQIVLALQNDGRAVVYGAIKIYLEHFSPSARALILEMKQPLGTILRSQNIAHSSHPAGYFKVRADEPIRRALALTSLGQIVYGRRNVLLDSARNTLAQVLEILPPSLPDAKDGRISD